MADTDKSRVDGEVDGPGVRQPGFYWVRDADNGQVVICLWQPRTPYEASFWQYPGSEMDFCESDFTVLSGPLEQPQ